MGCRSAPTFRTIAQTDDVPEHYMHLLMNHSIPGVNADYVTRNKLLGDNFRNQYEAMAAANTEHLMQQIVRHASLAVS